MNIALVGDFAQLPPVGDTPLYSPPSKAATENGALSREGSVLYNLFTSSYRLQIVHRQEGESPEQVKFRNLTRTERNLDQETRDLFADCVCLYTTRNDVHDLNVVELQALNQPCARILAQHDGGPAAVKALAEDAGGLESHILLARGAKVMITRNIINIDPLKT
ncbi:hypothetical protein CPC08DRAFT_717863 [Agrocybe pediades]|nr:hypothetical protein CPC08DRAFT_717863 [Agrocybe pediades]